MVSPFSHQSAGRSDNRADYQAAFHQRVHRLLQLAYESLAPADHARVEEDDITGDLCKHMRHLTEIAPQERWMGRFSIHDQDPSNDVPSAKTGQPRKGKRRPKIDIRIVCKHQIPNRGYCIEAKRLYRSDSVSEYVDEEGVGAFICGEYAMNDDSGGMIGYVQTGDVTDWINKIEAKLRDHPSLINKTDQVVLRPIHFRGGPEWCLTSSHRRESGRELALFHVMFLFQGV